MQGRSIQRRTATRAQAWRWLALGLLTLPLYSAGCFQSGTQPTSVAGGPTPVDLPSLAEIQSVVGSNSAQSSALASAYDSWVQAEKSARRDGPPMGEPPVLDFIAAAAPVLDGSQLERLIASLHAFEAGRIADQGLDGRLFGAPPPGGGGPGGRGGHHGPGGPPHGGPGGDPFGNLGLTQDRRTQVRQAEQSLRSTVDSLVVQLRSGAITSDQFEAGVAAAEAAFETALQGILTAEQYVQLQQERRDHWIAQLQGRVANFDSLVARRVRGLTRILGLNDTQSADIRTILANTKGPIQAVLAGLQDGSLTPQAARSTLRQIERDATAAIRATLSEAQAAIFDRLVHLRRLFPGCHP